ncbi:hypothetical protein, partial [Escherichia coli]
MDRIKYLKWIAEESPTDDEIDNYDSIISRGAERAEKVQLSLSRLNLFTLLKKHPRKPCRHRPRKHH